MLILHRPIYWLFLVALVILQVLRAHREAKVLEAAFGDAYREISPQNLVLTPEPDKEMWGNISAMKKVFPFVLCMLCAAILLGVDDKPQFPSMPAAVSGNAVASVKGGFLLFSLMGVGPRKTWDDVTSQIYVMTLSRSGKWAKGRDVPGVAGRLNAAAAGAKGLVVLMGG